MSSPFQFLMRRLTIRVLISARAALWATAALLLCRLSLMALGIESPSASSGLQTFYNLSALMLIPAQWVLTCLQSWNLSPVSEPMIYLGNGGLIEWSGVVSVVTLCCFLLIDTLCHWIFQCQVPQWLLSWSAHYIHRSQSLSHLQGVNLQPYPAVMQQMPPQMMPPPMAPPIMHPMAPQMSPQMMPQMAQQLYNIGSQQAPMAPMTMGYGSFDGQMREVTVLFCDIRGYTSLVEKYPPSMVIQQLNEYFSAMTQVIYHHRGRLDKYIGDGFMAYFEPTDGSVASCARHGVLAALQMRHVLKQMNQRWKQQGYPTLDIGIGINTGLVFVGNIGSLMKMDYTIIGDNVNLAARLEQLNKTFKTQIIISEATHQLVKEVIQSKFLGNVSIRGKQQSVTVYEVKSSKALQTPGHGQSPGQPLMAAHPPIVGAPSFYGTS
ncbi:MAG: adenylate/guanylate cyclase domain-containing protein [Cyanobacteria bacterium]|nr:adenylate/guanylate cyclase domain-containing protein [Cyanobacteriota bacterium]